MRAKTTKEVYDANIRNAKSIKRILERSWFDNEFLKKINKIIENYKLEDEERVGFYDWGCENGVYGFPMGYIARPTKIKAFSKYRLDYLKKQVEEKGEARMYEYGNFDYSIYLIKTPEGVKGSYNREYKGCGNGYYSRMIDYDTYVFIEKD